MWGGHPASGLGRGCTPGSLMGSPCSPPGGSELSGRRAPVAREGLSPEAAVPWGGRCSDRREAGAWACPCRPAVRRWLVVGAGLWGGWRGRSSAEGRGALRWRRGFYDFWEIAGPRRKRFVPSCFS